MKNIDKSLYIVTGATGGIGQEIALSLAAEKKTVVLGCRSAEKANAVRDEIIKKTANKNVHFFLLDLSDNASIRAFVKEVLALDIPIHAIINNAGTMSRAFQQSIDGREMTFAVNLTGTLLLTFLLMPILESEGHIIFTTSITRKIYAPGSIKINESAVDFSQLGTYARSKTALTQFAMHMAHCYTNYNINCVDPGVVNSNMITMNRWYDRLADSCFRPFISNTKKGALPTLKALTLSTSGNIVTRRAVKRMHYDYIHDIAHGKLVTAIRDFLAFEGALL